MRNKWDEIVKIQKKILEGMGDCHESFMSYDLRARVFTLLDYIHENNIGWETYERYATNRKLFKL